jgi:hypothetical protein
MNGGVREILGPYTVVHDGMDGKCVRNPVDYEMGSVHAIGSSLF